MMCISSDLTKKEIGSLMCLFWVGLDPFEAMTSSYYFTSPSDKKGPGAVEDMKNRYRDQEHRFLP